MNRQSRGLLDLVDVLVTRRAGLQQSLAGELRFLRSVPQENILNLPDSALSSEGLEVASRLAEEKSNELLLIEEALGRVENGLHGVCERCGKRIPQARMEAVPHATRCVKCQRVYEIECAVDEKDLVEA